MSTPDDAPNLPPEATIQPCVPVSLVSTSNTAATATDTGGKVGRDGGGGGVVVAEIRLDPSIKKGWTGASSGVVDGIESNTKKSEDGDQSTAAATSWSERCFVVGRQASSSDIRIQHPTISRRHAILYVINHESQNSCRLFVRDLGGKHGTAVNGRRVGTVADPRSTGVEGGGGNNGDLELQSGDEIQFGNVRQIFRVLIGGATVKSESARPVEHVAEASHSQSPRNDNENHDNATPVDSLVVDRSRMEAAGHGLSGRAKRQAEIDAMMASLDDAPTYIAPPVTSAQSPFESGSRSGVAAEDDDDENDDADVGGRVARDHGIPITQRLTIPSEMKASTASTNAHPRTRGGVATCLAVDAAGSRFVLGGSDNHLRFYDVGGMRKNRLESFLDVIPEEGHLLQSVAFSPSGDRLLVATSSVQPTVLDRDGRVVVQFCRGDMYVTDPAKTVGHTAQVTCVDWHPLERDVVITGSLDGSARLWNLNGKTQFDKLVCDKVFAVKNSKGQRTSVTSVAFHPGGREFAVGTSCGSVQIFSRSRVSVTRPERALYGAHGGPGGGGASNNSIPVTCLVYSVDGSKLASRCAQDSTVRVWDPRRLSRSSLPLLDCGLVDATHENANVCFNLDGSLLCVGQSTAVRSGKEREERGSLQIFQVPDVDDSTTSDARYPTKATSPMLVLPFEEAAPLIVRWHVKLNQIFVACADGRILILFHPNISNRGGALLISSSKVSRDVDDLSRLLKLKAEASTTVTGEIYTPLTMPRGKPLFESERKRKRLERKDPVKSHEPERPASGKHKTGGQTGGSVTFQQFVADQRVSKAKAIAGKDPREALFQYTEGKNYVGTAYEGNVHKLAEKTAEEEQEELKKAGR